MLHVQVPAIIALSPDPGIPGRLTGARCVREAIYIRFMIENKIR